MPNGPGNLLPPSAGLPPSAQARLRRWDTARAHTSLLPVGGAAALDAVGFEPVGDVMGCTVALLAEDNLGICAQGKPTVKLGGARWGAGAVSYTRQVRDAYARVIGRLRAEAAHMGADGIVDVRLSTERHEATEELFAVGTAVRARSRTRPDAAFCTDLAGTDVAALLLSGWTPVDLVVAVQIGIRHDDAETLGEANLYRTRTANRTNIEVSGFTQVSQTVMDSGARIFADQVKASGADGGLMTSIDTTSWHRGCIITMNGTDHIVRSLIIGSSVARFAKGPQPPPRELAILPVTPRRRAPRHVPTAAIRERGAR